MQGVTKESHKYFDPQALLAEDTVRFTQDLFCRGQLNLANPRCLAMQLIPTTFRYAVKTLGRSLDPTCPSEDVSDAACSACLNARRVHAARSGNAECYSSL